jgi:hypothetical protein
MLGTYGATEGIAKAEKKENPSGLWATTAAAFGICFGRNGQAQLEHTTMGRAQPESPHCENLLINTNKRALKSTKQ